MSTKQTEALKLALEALEYHIEQTRPIHRTSEAITAIREALAEQPKVWVTPKLRPLAKLAKELDGVVADVEQGDGFDDVCLDTVKYVRDELAEQPAQQEPVALARMKRGQEILRWNRTQAEPPITVTKELWVAEQLEQFYTSPPASKPWVGLTDEEIDVAWNNCEAPYGFAEDIEAKLKEKNA